MGSFAYQHHFFPTKLEIQRILLLHLFIMTQLENNNDDFTSDNLFPDDDFLSIIDNIPFSGGKLNYNSLFYIHRLF
jgi:hypothetical protein